MKHLDLCSGVYRITCKENGKFYIGSAHHFRRRWNLHKVHLRKGVHDSKNMQNSWNKYGPESFDFEVLMVCDKPHVLMYEQIFLDALNPPFNTCKFAGSNAGIKLSAETKAGMGAAQRKWRKKYNWKGQSLCISDIAEMENIDANLLMARVMTLEKTIEEAVAMGEPLQNKQYEYQGRWQGRQQWAKELGIPAHHLRIRLQRGMTVAEAVRDIECKEKRISFSELCRLNSINMATAHTRLTMGMGVMEAITTPLLREAA